MYTCENFRCTEERYRDWFAKLTMRKYKETAYITPPISHLTGEFQGQELVPTNKPNRYFEAYIMDNLLWNLIVAVKADVIEWDYHGDYPSVRYKISKHEWGYEYRKQVS